MTAGTNRTTIRDAGDAIRRRETFIAGDGSLSARFISFTAPNGRASRPVIDALRDAIATTDAPLYVVLSYGTPIAWAAGPGPLTVPDVKYSVTTSRHQGIARRAHDPIPEYRHKGARA
jgi:hypothetical protein